MWYQSEREIMLRETVDVCNSQTHFDSAAQAINDVICTNQRPGACEINWVDAVDGGRRGRRRRLEDVTTMTYVITITQDVSDVSMNTTTFLTADIINDALKARGNDKFVITTDPVQDQVELSLTITTTAKGSTCVKGNEGVMCAVCKSLGGLSRCSEVHVTHAARSPLLPRAGSSGYYRAGAFSPCEKCGDDSWAMLSAFLVLVGMIIVLAVFIAINRRAPSGLIRPFINLVQQLTVMLARNAPLPTQQSAAYALLHFDLYRRSFRRCTRSSPRRSKISVRCWAG